MKTIRTVRSIIEKEFADIFKNKRLLMIIFLFPIMYFILSLIAKDMFAKEGEAFVLMHVILVPIMIMATIVAEEKEKGTLKLLMLSGVSTLEYIIGIMITLLTCIIFGLLAFVVLGALQSDTSVQHYIIILYCAACSMIIGGMIGVSVPNLMSVSLVALPVILIIFFMPMIGILQPQTKNITGLFYSSVVNDILMGSEITIGRIGILVLNLVLVGIFFSVFFQRKRILQDVRKR